MEALKGKSMCIHFFPFNISKLKKFPFLVRHFKFSFSIIYSKVVKNGLTREDMPGPPPQQPQNACYHFPFIPSSQNLPLTHLISLFSH